MRKPASLSASLATSLSSLKSLARLLPSRRVWLSLPLVFTLGCWDFASLTENSPIPSTDGGDDANPACGKEPNGLQEDCTDPTADVNQNCLPGCQDPTCQFHTACLPGYRAAGSVNPNMNACSGSMPIYQNLATPDPCSTCACTAATGDCAGTLKVYNDQTNCMNDANVQATINVRVATSRCPMVNGMNGSYYRLSAVTATGCAPAQATVTATPQWGTTNYLCTTTTSKTQVLGDLIGNNQCVVFDGDVECPTFKDRNGIGFTNKQLFYDGVNGTSQCACSCTAQANACQIPAATDLRLTDQMTCNNPMKTTNIAANNMCTASTDATMMAYSARSLQVGTAVAIPTCTRGGTASGQLTARNPITACCK